MVTYNSILSHLFVVSKRTTPQSSPLNPGIPVEAGEKNMEGLLPIELIRRLLHKLEIIPTVVRLSLFIIPATTATNPVEILDRSSSRFNLRKRSENCNFFLEKNKWKSRRYWNYGILSCSRKNFNFRLGKSTMMVSQFLKII